MKYLLQAIDAHRGDVPLNDSDLLRLLSEARKGRDEREEYQEAMERILTELRNYTEHSQAFLTRVSKRDAPDYYDVIKNPMDLGTMQKKLRSGQYKTKAQFAHDLNLIWDNCLVYNASPQHPLRRNATYMRKKSNHLLEFLSEKNDTKDLLSQWHPASLRVTPSPSTPDASPAAASGTPAPDTAPTPDTAAAAMPAPQVPTADHASDDVSLEETRALRRSIQATHTFCELDEALSHAHEPREISAAWDALRQVRTARRNPLDYALRTAPESVHRAWWAACQSDSLVCGGLPAVAYGGLREPEAMSPPAAEAGPSRAPAVTSRLPMDRPGVPRLMAQNIQTLRRLYQTHSKLYQLAEAVELDLPVPASVGEISDDEDDTDGGAPVLAPPQPYETTAPYPRLTRACAREQISWQVQTILAHAGFEGGQTTAVQVLAQVASEYLMGLGRTLRLYSDRFARRLEPSDVLEHVLGGGAASIEAYVRNDIERYGQRLKEWLRKMHAALRDQLQALGGTVEDTDLLARDGEALMLGHFAAGLGDDFFGFRELGLDTELGMAHLAVPSRLFFGGSSVHKTAVGGAKEAAPTYAPPPPPIVLTRAAVPAQIGLLRPWYLSEMGSEATLPDQVPERPRYKVPTNGKLPTRALASDDDARAAKTPTKRKRVLDLMSGTEKRATQGGAPRGASKLGKPSKGRDAADGAVSLPKHAGRAAQGINFGTVDDQNAEMSSSPAAQPASGEHLRGAPPAAFGSVTAESGAAPEKSIGFAGKKQLDFQKLFQAPPSTDAPPADATAQGAPANAAKPKVRPAPPPGKQMGAAPAPYMPGWQPPMYPHMSFPVSPGPGTYPPYLASPQQPWTPGTPGSPHVGNLPASPNMLPPNVSPRPGGMQARPGGASFYPAAASPSGFTMNAGARLFEPQKSKALRIVNPETHTEIDLEQVKKASSSASASPKPAEPTPAPAPKLAPPKEQPSESSRVKTQADFQQKVLRLKMEKAEEARKAEEAKAAEAKAAEEARKAEEAKAAEAKAAEEAKAEAAKAEEAKAEKAKAEKAKAEEAKAEEAKAEEAKAEVAKAEAAKVEQAKAAETPAALAVDEPDAAADEEEANDAADAPEPNRAIESARRIDDLSSITYPENVQPPKAELNVNAVPGRYRYDREFLLQFMSVYSEKPHDLPDLAAMGMESVAARGGRRGAGSSRGGMGRGGALKSSEERFASSVRGGAFGGGMSSGSRGNSLSRGGSGGPVPSRETMGTGIPMGARPKSNRGRQRGPHVNPPEKGGPTIPLDQVAPLAYSENRWKPQSLEKDQLDPALVVERKVKSLLNKLTVEKFESISDQIVEYANKSVDETDGRTLRQVIALVFEKAIDESAWSEMYAQLCAKIQMNLSPDIQDQVLDEKEQKEYRGGMLFRKYLLTWCQGDFEKGWGAQKEKEKSDKGAELLTDEYYAEQKAKRRGLGLVQFVGELFKLQMLQPRIMHTCIVRLLRTTTEPEEDEIESVCRLLTTVGYLLDTSSGNHKSRMDVYFKRIDDILQSPALSSRMRFMLMDVVDLRSSNWVPRHDNTAPKTIAEIHAEAAKEQQQKEMEKLSLHRGGSRRGQPRHSAASGGDSHAHDGWSTVGHAPSGRARPSDLPGLGKGADRASGKPGAGLFGRKAQGCEEPASPSPRSSSNMFNLLTGDGSQGEEKERKKLQLQPRTKPLETPAEPAAPSAEDMQRKIGNDVKEFLAIRDISEGVQSIEALPAEHRATFVDQLVAAVLDKKQDSVDDAGRLLAQLVEKQVLNEQQLMEGFQPQVTILDDTSMDAPSAYGFMAQLLVQSTLPRAQIEQLADKMEGEGLRPPKDRLLAKVDDIVS
ncbi:hypothetical protein MCAP1_003297 [Malassezia caprae]|uniref:MI domain-containing protein n=1 Tax=Malassezia caprae TaxID=1381934 RepID=A0AAF0E779_9BASI|nr:hypothetical protein MCAP1_003297 [Malassezia caprae]